MTTALIAAFGLSFIVYVALIVFDSRPDPYESAQDSDPSLRDPVATTPQSEPIPPQSNAA
jgi:hypothetical protein